MTGESDLDVENPGVDKTVNRRTFVLKPDTRHLEPC